MKIHAAGYVIHNEVAPTALSRSESSPFVHTITIADNNRLTADGVYAPIFSLSREQAREVGEAMLLLARLGEGRKG